MEVYEVSLILMWVSSLITLFVVTIFLKDKRDSWGRFWSVFFFTVIITGLILIFLIMSPDQIMSVVDSLNGKV